jgi:hypothetical protein
MAAAHHFVRRSDHLAALDQRHRTGRGGGLDDERQRVRRCD